MKVTSHTRSNGETIVAPETTPAVRRKRFPTTVASQMPRNGLLPCGPRSPRAELAHSVVRLSTQVCALAGYTAAVEVTHWHTLLAWCLRCFLICGALASAVRKLHECVRAAFPGGFGHRASKASRQLKTEKFAPKAVRRTDCGRLALARADCLGKRSLGSGGCGRN